MTFVIEVKKKKLEIKFNYRLMFKANKHFASVDKDGKKQNDGAGVLFSKILDNDDEVVVGLVQLASKDKVSEEDVLEAVEKFVEQYDDEEQGYQALFDELKNEMVQSGFFKKKIEKYIENMEKSEKFLKGKEDEETKIAVLAIKELSTKMKNELSSSTVPEED